MIRTFVADSDVNIKPIAGRINSVINEQIPVISDKLGISWGVDVIIQNDGITRKTIGVGGYTPSMYLVQINLNPESFPESDLVSDLTATLAHELSHVKRYDVFNYKYNLDKTTILDYLVFEGLAVAFEKEYMGTETKVSLASDDSDTAQKLYGRMEPFFDLDYWEDRGKDGYDFVGHWFVNGDSSSGIPYNAGYILGYWIVQHYMRQLKVEKVVDIISLPTHKFIGK